jgi:predicted TPR repeat methyltransferase
MKTPNDYNIDRVYSYESSEDLKRYYNDWADEYDTYAKDVNYILPDKVAEVFFKHISNSNYKETKKNITLDIGCGTGLLGESLSSIDNNLWIEGVDISSSMIGLASLKRKKNFVPLYDWMITDDLTSPKLILENYYDYFVSSGTFTLGHLGSNDLVNLLIYLKPEGTAVISVKEDHFIKDNFEKVLLNLKKQNIINTIFYFKVSSYNSNFEADSIIVKFKKV